MAETRNSELPHWAVQNFARYDSLTIFLAHCIKKACVLLLTLFLAHYRSLSIVLRILQ